MNFDQRPQLSDRVKQGTPIQFWHSTDVDVE
jgi:hypothetical protein